ncbi:BrnT family toxin [Desulfobulbus sp. US1]|nr:BrnT family toxin [Desulfobulbus sp. US4]MCW5208906.1 BrnT family toxin [Desulfobulbus sp. US1]
MEYLSEHYDKERCLFIAFTVRKSLIRVISARDMSRKERRIYESAEKNIAPAPSINEKFFWLNGLTRNLVSIDKAQKKGHQLIPVTLFFS